MSVINRQPQAFIDIQISLLTSSLAQVREVGPNPFERQFLIRIEGVRGSNPLSSTQKMQVEATLQFLLDHIGSHSGSQVVAFLTWSGVAMAKTASTSTTRPTAVTAPITGLARAGGVAWYRSASVRTGSGSGKRSAARPGPRSR